MGKLLRMGLVSLALLACGGCTAVGYFHTVATCPTEAPWQSQGYLSGQVYPHACFNMTAADLRAGGYLLGRGGPLIGLFWLPFFAVELPVSLCADVVSTPWQVVRYRSFPEYGIKGHDESLDRTYYMSPLVPQLLRGLKTMQDPDGGWSARTNRLAATSLAVLALARHGDTPWTSPSSQEFVSAFSRGAEALRTSAEVMPGGIRFRGESDDPRAFPMAAAAVIEVCGLSREGVWRELAEKCVARLAEDEAPFWSAELDARTIECLRWTVMALESAKSRSLDVPGLDARLKRAKFRLSCHGAGDEGVYDAWCEHYALEAGEAGADSRWRFFDKARMDRIAKLWSVRSLPEPVKDDAGTPRWAGFVEGDETDARYVRASGLGKVADTALLVLPFVWPESAYSCRAAGSVVSLSGK